MIPAANPRQVPTADDLGRLPDYTSPADLALMADAIRALKGEDRKFFAYDVFCKGLMSPIANEDDELAHAMLARATEMNAVPQIISMMIDAFPEVLDDMIEVTAKHCTDGLDKTDINSAGGWNADEVASAYASLYVARRGLTVPFGMNVQ